MTVRALLSRAAGCGVTMWLEGGRVRLRADQPPPADLLRDLRTHRDDLARLLAGEGAEPPPLSAEARALADAAHAAWEALANREPDPVEDAERRAIFGQPDPAPGAASHGAAVAAEPPARPRPGPPLYDRITLAWLRAPGAEVRHHRDGWVHVSLPDGRYSFISPERAKRLGFRG